MYSMTGYGRAEYKEDGIDLLVEVKTVNNRNLDVNIKTPRSFIAFEDSLRKCVKSKLTRGRVDVFVNFNDTRESKTEPVADLALAKCYVDAAERLAKATGIPNDFTVTALMRVPDVLKENNAFADYSEFESALTATANTALDRLNDMRRTEGEKLVADIRGRMAVIEKLVDRLSERAPEVKADFAAKLKARIEEALDGIACDESRLLTEVAFFADKSNIDEELTRLKSHIAQFYCLLKGEGVGKQIDFLVQEFNREANTVCSKANDLRVTEIGLALKSEIEKIREQIQNLE